MLRRQAHVVCPGDPDYRWVRAGYSRRNSSGPARIVFASDIEHIIDTVLRCKKLGEQLSVRSSGFGQADPLFKPGAVVLDVSRLNTVMTSRSADTVTVGAGAQALAVADVLSAKSSRVPMGMHPGVSLVGMALAGGIGMSSRALGLTCDSLLEAEMIDSDGNLVRASETTNPDLFWALRGGGCAGFGVITSMLFRTCPSGPVVLFSVAWPRRQVSSVFEAWQEWAPTADSRMSCFLSLPSAENHPIYLDGQFFGTEHRLLALLAPMLRTGSALAIDTRTVPQREAVRAFSELRGPHPMFRCGATLAQPLAAHAVHDMVSHLNQSPTETCIKAIALGGSVSEPEADACAFPWRNSLFMLEATVHWSSRITEPAALDWWAELRRILDPSAEGAYAGWPDPGVDDWLTAAYGRNLPRLRRIHARWDPYNVFKHRFGLGWA